MSLDQMQRRWEELEMDCLVNVLGRVGLESLLFDAPFVCKSWYTATLNPSCWERLIFPDIPPDLLKHLDDIFSYIHLKDTVEHNPSEFDPFIRRYVHGHRFGSPPFSITAFTKFVLRRSSGNAALLKLPRYCSEAALKSVVQMCPGLKFLALHEDSLLKHSRIIPEVIGNLKSLKTLLLMGDCYELKDILLPISIECKNFVGLCFYDASFCEHLTKPGSDIANLLPNIRYLILRKTYIQRDSLVAILTGCKQLVRLHLSDCSFEMDDEILNLASGISDFRCSEDFEGYYVDDDLGYVCLDEAVYFGWDKNYV